jgi:PleD family two-component response regulator
MTDRARSGREPLVLIANDQEWSARSLESILAPNGFVVLRAYTGHQALDRARTARPDLIILDAQMPDISGVEVCRRLRTDPRFSATTPILITTAGPSGRTQRLEAYQAGAWEFLGQPLDGESLLLKLNAFLASKLEADQFRDETLLDQTSGLYNMRGLSRRAREIGSEAYRLRQPLACIVFMAELPDAPLPGPAAEEVAERVGRILRTQGRAGDALGRLGDEEFAVIAPGTLESGIPRLVDRYERALSGDDGKMASVRLRAGYFAVSNFAQAQVDAVEMLLRATSALRQLLAGGLPERLLPFDQAAPLTPAS